MIYKNKLIFLSIIYLQMKKSILIAISIAIVIMCGLVEGKAGLIYSGCSILMLLKLLEVVRDVLNAEAR